VQRGEPKTDVAAQFGVSRQSVHNWCVRYAADGLAGLVDPPTGPSRARTRPPRKLRSACVSRAGKIPGGVRTGSPTSWAG
jgi:transposase